MLIIDLDLLFFGMLIHLLSVIDLLSLISCFLLYIKWFFIISYKWFSMFLGFLGFFKLDFSVLLHFCPTRDYYLILFLPYMLLLSLPYMSLLYFCLSLRYTFCIYGALIFFFLFSSSSLLISYINNLFYYIIINFLFHYY